MCMFDFHVNFGTSGTVQSLISLYILLLPFFCLKSPHNCDIRKKGEKVNLSVIIFTTLKYFPSIDNVDKHLVVIKQFVNLYFQKLYYENSCEFIIIITRRWYRFLLLAIGSRFT
jgi:hypothetical protein